MADIKDRAREYLRSQTQLNGGGLYHCNILNLILGFAEQETKELEKENAELKEKLEMGIALKDEEMGCIETDFNTFKSKAKEYIKLLLMNCVGVYESTGKTITEIQAEAKEFLKEE